MSPLSTPDAAGAAFDAAAVRAEFPQLDTPPDGVGVAYLDSAATTQKPRVVLDAEREFYERHYGAVARGVYRLSAEATALYESARERVGRFLGAPAEEIVFVRGTTEAINLVAASWGPAHVGAGDEILVTGLEHHSNIVPWQLLAERQGARLVAAPLDARGDVPLEGIERALASGRVRLVAAAHVSNALGTKLDVARIARMARAAGARLLVDGAQSAPRLPLSIAELGCDFFAFSGHKAYGPNGIGVLWGRSEILEAMPPWQGGGGMVERVTFERTTYLAAPHRFEAGTPAAPQAHGLAVALDWIERAGREAIHAHESDLLSEICRRLDELEGIRRIGDAEERVGVVSFVVDGVHAHDVGTVLDAAGVAVRAGHHCAQPAMAHFGVPATVRASLGAYSTRDDVDRLIAAVERAVERFAR